MNLIQFEIGLPKEVLFEQAGQLIAEFNRVNHLPEIPIRDDPTLRGFGRYGHDVIWVNVRSTGYPTRTRSRVWTFPGHKTDRSAAGVPCHENGHHVWFNGRWRIKGWRELIREDKPITSYEPNPGEAYAETLRLFQLNPDLLRCGRPERYEFLVGTGLRPVVEADWRTILHYAPEHIIRAAENFLS